MQLEGVAVINANAKANAIMQLVISRKERNDPQRHLKSFRFKAYNKLLVTADPDSIDAHCRARMAPANCEPT